MCRSHPQHSARSPACTRARVAIDGLPPTPGEGESVYVVNSERPPLELHAEVVMPDGSSTIWHSGSRDPGTRPQGISFRTARMDGFKDGSCSLPRRIDQPQPDLALFNTLRFVGADGSIAYEGRMAALPRESGSPPTWSVQAAGLMANAKDRRFRMIFVDRDMSQWQDAPLERRAAMANAGYPTGKIQGGASGSGISWELPNEALGTGEHHDLMYDAGPGCRDRGNLLSRCGNRGVMGTVRRTGHVHVREPDAIRGNGDSADLGQHEPRITGHAGAALRRAGSVREQPGDAAAGQRRFDMFNVIGNHGITLFQAVDGVNGCHRLERDPVADRELLSRPQRRWCAAQPVRDLASRVPRPHVPVRRVAHREQLPPLGPRGVGGRHRPLRATRPHRLRLGTPARRLRNAARAARPRRGGGRQRDRSPVHRRQAPAGKKSYCPTTGPSSATPTR